MSSRKPRTYRTQAVVLRHSDFGEADRLLSVFTREEGKVRAIAKGVRKIRSRKAGHLEPFTHVNLLLARGRTFHIITQAETIDTFLPLREDLQMMGYASYVVELLDRFTYDEDENRALFRLLTNTLKRLSTTDDPRKVLLYYEIRLLDQLGYRPDLKRCVACETEIQPEDQYFSAQLGGVLCPRCGAGRTEARPISMDALRYLRHFQRSSFDQADRARISPEVHRELEAHMHHYLTYLLERGLNSPVFLKRLERERGTPSQD